MLSRNVPYSQSLDKYSLKQKYVYCKLIVAQWRNIVAAAYCVKTLYFSLWRNSPKFKML